MNSFILFSDVYYEYEFFRQSNGFHLFHHYVDSTGKLVNVKDLYKLRFSGIKFKRISHIGYKCNINDVYSYFSLFTSHKETMFFDAFKIQNIELNNNMFKNANHPIITKTSILSDYFIISDNLHHFPKWSINMDKSTYENINNIYENGYLALNQIESHIGTGNHIILDKFSICSWRDAEVNYRYTLKAYNIRSYHNNLEIDKLQLYEDMKNFKINNKNFKSDLFYDVSNFRSKIYFYNESYKEKYYYGVLI